MTLQDVPTDLLLAHPENSNFMDAETLRKLQRHIERTGRYEPLTVRPQPGEPGKFQVVNGHNRLRVLRALKLETARCIVWNLDDAQTRLYLATLNRLSGNEIPERRMALLENLLTDFDIDELSALLPEDRKQLEQLEQMVHLESDHIAALTDGLQTSRGPVFLTFLLEAPEAKEVNLALDLILNSEQEDLSRAHALVRLAQFFLRHHGALANE